MKGLPRGELSGAQSERKGQRVFKTAERRAETTCFGDASSCLETMSFINFPLSLR
jgi:hypothetical protein